MSSFLAKVFSPLPSAPAEVVAELTQIVHKSYFTTIGDNGKEVESLLAITNNYLFVSQVRRV